MKTTPPFFSMLVPPRWLLCNLPPKRLITMHLQEVQWVHVHEDGRLRDFLGITICQCAAQQLCQNRASERLQQELETVFLFQSCQRRGRRPQNADFLSVMRRKIFGELAGPPDCFF